MFVALGVFFEVAGHALVEGDEDAEVGHAEGYVVDFAYFGGEVGTDFEDVGLGGAEDGDGAVFFSGVLALVGVVGGALVVVAEDCADVVHR